MVRFIPRLVLILVLTAILAPLPTAHAAGWVVNSPNNVDDGICNATREVYFPLSTEFLQCVEAD